MLVEAHHCCKEKTNHHYTPLCVCVCMYVCVLLCISEWSGPQFMNKLIKCFAPGNQMIE